MGTVKTATQKIADSSLEECRECLKSAFDINSGTTSSLNKAKTGPVRTNLSNLQNIRTRIWSDLEKAFSEEIFYHCKQIKFLQTILNDLDVHGVNINIASQFWSKLGQIIAEEIKISPSTVLQMLEEGYPKLLKCYYEMCRRLNYGEYNFK